MAPSRRHALQHTPVRYQTVRSSSTCSRNSGASRSSPGPPFAPKASRGLYDVCLSLSVDEKVVGNDVSADDKLLVLITGANRGGKSTLLRGMGLAHLMMQCGRFAPAEFFRANACNGIFTHYRREEDAGMKSGKVDEELRRMGKSTRTRSAPAAAGRGSELG